MPDVTRIQDVLIPDRWNDYFIERTAELSAIRQSGIMTTTPGLSVPYGGTTVNMPFWTDIDGEDEVWASGHETIPDPITAAKEIAVILTRIKSWGAEDLAGMFAGDDPLTAIAQLVGAYWARKEQKTLISILKGIFANALVGNMLDKSTVAMGLTMMVDALGVLGDASEKISAIVMHSATRNDLFKKKLLIPSSGEPGSSDKPEFDTFLGRRVIVDDGTPRDGDVYTTYLFGYGAIGYADGRPRVPVEVERQATKSQEVLVHRRQFIMHPRGLKWTGNAVNTTPSNTELETAANWELVFENKNVPIIALKHMIDAA